MDGPSQAGLDFAVFGAHYDMIDFSILPYLEAGTPTRETDSEVDGQPVRVHPLDRSCEGPPDDAGMAERTAGPHA